MWAIKGEESELGLNFVESKTGDELKSGEFVWEVSEKPWVRGNDWLLL